MKKLFIAVFSAFVALALLISIGAYRTQAKEFNQPGENFSSESRRRKDFISLGN